LLLGKYGKGTLGRSLIVLLFLLLPIGMPKFFIFLLTEIFILGLFGLAVNLLVGYSGMVTFGHGAFYGLGAYTVGLLMTKTGIPFAAAMFVAPLTAAAFGLIIGFFCVRLTQFYFAMLTLAFGMLVWAIIYKWESFTGGDNGLVGVVLPSILSSPQAIYYFTLGVFAVCLAIQWKIINSPFGYTMRAIRENPERVRFLGIPLTRYKLAIFVVSAGFAGISGGLYTAFTKGAFPDYASWAKSGEGLIMVLIGGMSSFIGPLIGSAVLLFLQQIVTTFFKYWSIVLGFLLLLVVLFLPEGVMGAGVRIRFLSRPKEGENSNPGPARKEKR